MAFKKIMLAGGDKPRIAEYPANTTTIYPGCILTMNASNEVVIHATAGGMIVPLMVALENSIVGKSVADAYGTGDRVQVWFPQRGDLALLRILNGETVAIADLLESGASGLCRKRVADTSAGTIALNSIVGQAEVACDMSGSNLVDPSPLTPIRIA
jgi:hypothetical protein